MFNKPGSALNTQAAGNESDISKKCRNCSTTLYVPLPACFAGMVCVGGFTPRGSGKQLKYSETGAAPARILKHSETLRRNRESVCHDPPFSRPTE
jgi:hypothetical protein